MTPALEFDLAIFGGGLAGVSAALVALQRGLRVFLAEPTDWIGGQITAQAVSALDEHEYIETFGGTALYTQFRQAVRAAYGGVTNPGNGWVSRLCFEPRVGLKILQEWLKPYQQTGQLTLWLRCVPTQAEVRAGQIHSVTVHRLGAEPCPLFAPYFVDATELGDLLPLVGAPYVTGAESFEDTHEPDAPTDGAHLERVQGFTHCFLVEYRPGEDHTLPHPPSGYAQWRDRQPFSLILTLRGGGRKRFPVFDGDLPFWEYRRLYHAAQFADPARPFDVALINWDSNDYHDLGLLDQPAAEVTRALQSARDLSLAFLYWLQTEAPHDDDQGCGFPGMRLLTDALGTPDGLAQYPYIRESRRLIGLTRVTEQQVIAPLESPQTARAPFFPDSVGLGYYPLDLHRCVNDGGIKPDLPVSLPYQIPLGMMLSPTVSNLIAAGKCAATTHLTNGAYRLHPTEWAMGEAAADLAAYCLANACAPAQVRSQPAHLRALQAQLIQRGTPLYWTPDLPATDPDFAAVQRALATFGLPAASARAQQIEITPDAPVNADLASPDPAMSLREACRRSPHPGEKITRLSLPVEQGGG